MKVWELLARLEGADPEAEVVVRDGQLTLAVDDVAIDAPAEKSPLVVLVVTA